MSIRLSLDAKQQARIAAALQNAPQAYEKVCARAINRTLTGMRTDAVKLSRETYTIKATPLRRSIKLQRARPNKLQGEFVSRGANLSLMAFKVRPQTDTTGKRRRPVKAEVYKGESFTVERGFVYNRKVFARAGKARTPLEFKTGPAAPEMIKDEIVMNELQERANARLRQRIEHESTAYLAGFGRGK